MQSWAPLPSPRSGGAHLGGGCGAPPSPPLSRRRLSGSGAAPALGGRAGCPGARQELPRGTPRADRDRGDTSEARLRGTGARRSATSPRQHSAPGAPAPQLPGRGGGNRSPQVDDACPRRCPPPAGGEAVAAPVPTQAGPPPCRRQQILLRCGGDPVQAGRTLPRGGDGAGTAASVADIGGKDVCVAAASRAPEKREILFCSSTFPEIRPPRRPPPLQVLHYRVQVSAGILIQLPQSSYFRSKLGSLFRIPTPALETV